MCFGGARFEVFLTVHLPESAESQCEEAVSGPARAPSAGDGSRGDDLGGRGSRAAWFASYISTILQRDVRDLARVDALHSLPHTKLVSWIDPRIALRHFRTATGSEVDVVLEKPDGSVAAIEVKASATVAASDFAALKALQDQLGKQFRAGVVLYLGDQTVPFGDQLWLVPLPPLWEH